MRNIPTTSTGWGDTKIDVALPGKVSLPRHHACGGAHLPGDAVDLRLPCVTWKTQEEGLLAGEEASRGEVLEVIPGLGQVSIAFDPGWRPRATTPGGSGRVWCRRDATKAGT